MLPHSVVGEAARASAIGVVGIALYVSVFIGVASATYARPSFGTAALVALAPFAFYRDAGVTTLTFFKVALVGTIVGLVVGRRSIDGLRGGATATIGICLLAVIGATALSIVQASYREPAIRETAKGVEYLLLFLTVCVATRVDVDDRAVRTAFAGTSLVISALALLQEVTGAPSGAVLRGHALARIAGPLEGPNQLSAYLGITLCVVAAYMCARKATLLERVALPLGCAALTLTLSRAGVGSASLALALVCALSPRPVPRFVPGAIVAGIGAGFGLVAVWTDSFATGKFLDIFGRFSDFSESRHPGSVGTRSHLWRAAYVLWRRHPLLGIGAGNFELELARAGLPHVRTHANSLYLQSLVEGGIPLFFATLAGTLAPIVRFARSRRAHPLILAAFAASVGLALHQIVDLLVFYSKVGVAWWILLGLAAGHADAPLTARFPAAARVSEKRSRRER